MLLDRRYPLDLTSVGRARVEVEQALHTAGRPELVDRVRMVVDELVWNVILHARTPSQVRLLASTSGVAVEVGDDCEVGPHLGPVDGPAEGLRRVERFADAWGWRAEGEGKVVWARLDSASTWRVDRVALTEGLPSDGLVTVPDR